jgi:hypothetical protein
MCSGAGPATLNDQMLANMLCSYAELGSKAESLLSTAAQVGHKQGSYPQIKCSQLLSLCCAVLCQAGG